MKPVTYVTTLGEMTDKYNDWVCRYERGYLSRKTKITDNTPVLRSGDGRLFYYSPCYNSTQYILRVYLVKDGYYVRSVD